MSGGPGAQVLLSHRGSQPLHAWKVSGRAKRGWDKQLRGYSVTLDSPRSTQLVYPGRGSVGLVHRYLVLHVKFLPSSSFSLDLAVLDQTGQRRHLYFSTSFDHIDANPLHARIPFRPPIVNQWVAMVFDIGGFAEAMFHESHRCVTQIVIHPKVILRSIYTLREISTVDVGAGVIDIQADTPQTRFSAHVQHTTHLYDMHCLVPEGSESEPPLRSPVQTPIIPVEPPPTRRQSSRSGKRILSGRRAPKSAGGNRSIREQYQRATQQSVSPLPSSVPDVGPLTPRYSEHGIEVHRKVPERPRTASRRRGHRRTPSQIQNDADFTLVDITALASSRKALEDVIEDAIRPTPRGSHRQLPRRDPTEDLKLLKQEADAITRSMEDSFGDLPDRGLDDDIVDSRMPEEFQSLPSSAKPSRDHSNHSLEPFTDEPESDTIDSESFFAVGVPHDQLTEPEPISLLEDTCYDEDEDDEEQYTYELQHHARQLLKQRNERTQQQQTPPRDVTSPGLSESPTPGGQIPVMIPTAGPASAERSPEQQFASKKTRTKAPRDLFAL